jgi:broad specificity phosphatase PhoE
MNRTSGLEQNAPLDAPRSLTDEAFKQLSDTYRQALDEYDAATSVVYDSIRRRTLPTAEEFARKRDAQSTLRHRRKSFWKAVRQRSRLAETVA